MDDLNEPFDHPRRRGRRAAAAMAVLPVDIKEKPLKPLARLTKDETTIWRETVASVRSGWFSACENLLEVYVRAISVERQLAGLLRQANPTGEGFADLVRLHKSEMLAVAHLAGRLRLTVRSVKPRDTVRGAVRGPRPWDRKRGHGRMTTMTRAMAQRRIETSRRARHRGTDVHTDLRHFPRDLSRSARHSTLKDD